MNCKFSVIPFLLLGIGAASAQVSSHAPTVFTNTPAQVVAKPAPSSADKPVARVNSSILTDADLVREEYAIFPYAKQHNGIPKEFECPGVVTRPHRIHQYSCSSWGKPCSILRRQTGRTREQLDSYRC